MSFSFCNPLVFFFSILFASNYCYKDPAQSELIKSGLEFALW